MYNPIATPAFQYCVTTEHAFIKKYRSCLPIGVFWVVVLRPPPQHTSRLPAPTAHSTPPPLRTQQLEFRALGDAQFLTLMGPVFFVLLPATLFLPSVMPLST